MSLTLIDGGLPSRMTYAQWLNAHPEGIHPCLVCGGRLTASSEGVDDPLTEARVWCPSCGQTPAGGWTKCRGTTDWDTPGYPQIDWRKRGVW